MTPITRVGVPKEADPASAVAASHTRLPLALWHFLLLAVCFGIVAGWCEALVLMFRHYVLHRFVWTDANIVWMAPVSSVIFFTPFALLAGLVRGPNRPRAAAIVAFVFLAWTAAVIVDVAFGDRVHIIARWVLGVGLATQLTRWLVRRRWLSLDNLRLAAPVLCAVLVVLGLSMRGSRALLEQRALARLPEATPGARNVVFLILDTVRAASMSLYGFEKPTTPELERIAKRGVVFERGLATATWTLPSHSSMFTGRYPTELSADWFTPLDQDFRTIAEALRDNGYATGAFMANHFYTTPETGLARGFLRFRAYVLSWREVVLSSAAGQLLARYRAAVVIHERRHDRKSAAIVNSEFLDWLESNRDRPFFAVLNYFDAHGPYNVSPELARQFGGGAQGRYAASISYLDQQIGRLFNELDRRHLLQNTIVVITSDHGELFGEGGSRGHGARPFYRVLNVPLVIIAPGVPAETRVTAPVSLRDLPATLIDIAQLGRRETFPGESLTRYWSAEQQGAAPILSVARSESLVREEGARAPYMYSLVNDSLHYIRTPDRTELLFNYVVDQEERNDLARSRPEEVLQFRRLLDLALDRSKLDQR